MKTHLKFRVEVNPAFIREIGDIMSKCDLGISGIVKPEFYTCEWNTTTKVDKKYKAKMRKRIKEAFELKGSKVLSIKTIK